MIGTLSHLSAVAVEVGTHESADNERMPGTTGLGPVEARFSNKYSAFGCVVVATVKKEWRDEGGRRTGRASCQPICDRLLSSGVEKQEDVVTGGPITDEGYEISSGKEEYRL